MKIYNTREIINELKQDGWYLAETRGSHHHFKHPDKKGKVTVPIHSGDLHPDTAKSILKQAGLLNK